MKKKISEFKHKAVMLVDDNEIDIRINEMIIKGSGFSENVFCYSGGISSLDFFKNIELVKNLSEELYPEYIFLDINMPFLDGFQFLDEFKRFSKRLPKEVKIIILTGSYKAPDIEKANEYKDVVKFLTKPLTEKDLKNLN